MMLRLLIRHSAGFAFGAVVLLLAALPPEAVERGPVLCLYRRAFDIECLGCGLTRALSCLLHGRLADAAAHNRLVFIVLPLGFALAAWDVRAAVRRLRASGSVSGRRAEGVV